MNAAMAVKTKPVEAEKVKPSPASTPTPPPTSSVKAFVLPSGATTVPKVTKDPEPAKPAEPVFNLKQVAASVSKPTPSPPVQASVDSSTLKVNLEKKDNGLVSLVAKPTEEKPKAVVSVPGTSTSEPVSLFTQKPAINFFGGALSTATKVSTSAPSQVAPKLPTQSIFGGSSFSGAVKPVETSLPGKPETVFSTAFAPSAPATKDEPAKPAAAFSFGSSSLSVTPNPPKSESTLSDGNAATPAFGSSITSTAESLFQSSSPAVKADSTVLPKNPVDSLGSLVANLESTVGKTLPAQKPMPAVSIFPVQSSVTSVGTSSAASFSFAIPSCTASITTVTTSTVPSGPVIVVNPSAKAPLNLSSPPTASVFGGTTAKPELVEAKTPESGAATSTATTSTPTTTSAAVVDSTASMFGNFGLGSTPATTKPANIFGGATNFAIKPLGTSLFGGSDATSSAQSIFGSTEQPKSIFGTPNTSTASSFSFSQAFGSTPASSAATTSAPPTFSPANFVPTTTTQPIFGSASLSASTATTTAVTFGSAAPSTAVPFGGSTVFGQPASTSAFGGSSFSFATALAPQAQAPKTGAESSFTFSLPGLSSPTAVPAATTQSVFGAKPASPFGSTTPATTSQTTAATTQSVFGAKPASPFGSTTPATTSQTTFAGQPVCSPSAFGSGGAAPSPAAGATTNVFGGSKPVFGQTAAPSIFGGSPAPAFGQQSAFSQSPGR